MAETELVVIGAGLPGGGGVGGGGRNEVCLYEMRRLKTTPVHQMGDLDELVCSHSFKSNLPHNASGVLKEEMRR